MIRKYTSFLVCFHPNHSDVYLNGIPLAIIRDGVELNKVDPLTLPDVAFNNVPALRAELNEVLDKIEIELKNHERGNLK